ncbi:glycerate kinase family protein [Lactococcus cremoris]|uniref:Glycerate kinase n=2 Tax=Lactococcus lactis subsp. cremoris TaxID=1359 RepID=A0A166K6G1_LACLC|nr:glycerate kinase [Lactococcus cremoris]AGV72788.1 glycerate kinase [Lactococcus cremoris subsp. cremoris KW2]KGH34730.1 glycerate kinase [Lactococcus cremoris]KZK07694.1 Glycerate kinase [Lactococcus cremoris]MDR9867198.1 glycerate kinase [Lactococcus cremoris]PCS19844.1 glycerate kinase [Lactococcus cremoris subsp. tructae]
MVKKFVLAPDSFKESMSAKEVCQAMERGIKKVFPDADIISIPMADGGEGTTDSLVDATAGLRVYKTVSGPLDGTRVDAYFGILGNSNTAVIEMAKASGLELVEKNDRNPLITSTYGTGELIKAAIDAGVKKIIIGIGGSATNDGGSGMARALGAKFLDEYNRSIPLGGGFLDQLAKVDMTDFDVRVKDIEIIIASDVTNPLVGETGASVVFGPQKGATAEMISKLDHNLEHYADVIFNTLGKDIKDLPGAGAAGGLGAGLIAFTNAKMQLGIDIVAETTGLDEKIKEADNVFTGEGGMDFQTKFGKAPFGVSRIAKKYHKPCFALAGYIGKDVEVLYDEGMTAIFGIQAKAQVLSEAILEGPKNVERTSENIARMLLLI